MAWRETRPLITPVDSYSYCKGEPLLHEKVILHRFPAGRSSSAFLRVMHQTHGGNTVERKKRNKNSRGVLLLLQLNVLKRQYERQQPGLEVAVVAAVAAVVVHHLEEAPFIRGP